MSIWSRIANVFRGRRVAIDIDEELHAHLEEARAAGRDSQELAHAFGSPLRVHEAMRDTMVLPWLDTLRADTIFGWRQLRKHKIASTAAVLSLGLAIGSCTAAFRLVDALLWRPLPVKSPENLYVMGFGYINEYGQDAVGYSSDYPGFRRLRAAVKDDAELIAIDSPQRINLTFGSDDEMERVSWQHVSGWMFNAFGLNPALGRLLNEQDDLQPGDQPVAVLAYDYWRRRFGGDASIVGRTFRAGNDTLRIIGVAPEGFTGTDTGRATDIYVPTMLNALAINNPNWRWIRTWVQPKPGVNLEQVREKLRGALLVHRREQIPNIPPGTPQREIDKYLSPPVVLESAAAGVSDRQQGYRNSLAILGVLVALVLLIACANVANLMAAQASSRAREMALRVSIGAGSARLVQLVLVESFLIAIFASAVGFAFAWWAAPFVVGMLQPPDDPIQLIMPVDWRVAGFGMALTFLVTILFGIAPASRASSVHPASALKGGTDPHNRRRLLNGLVAVQVAFCLLVLLNAGLFASTFERLTHQHLGFEPAGMLALETVTKGEQPVQAWYEVARHLESLPEVESASVSGWALMSGQGWNLNVWANGRGPDGYQSPWFLGISPGWLATMKIPLLDGRDFRSDDLFPQVAAVNQAFARRYFTGQSPVGRKFETQIGVKRFTLRIVALVGDARYTGMREPISPTIYVPMLNINLEGSLQSESWATFVVRTKMQDPLPLASTLRRAMTAARSEFRAANIRTQEELVRMHTIRERMLAILSLFFAGVALVLAAVGLYGVLDYAVSERRREIGIRIALGARPSDIARKVTLEMFVALGVGATAGLALGITSERYIRSLLFEVKATDPWMIALPSMTILAAALLAAFPPVVRAVRTDPAKMLRAE